MFTFIKRTVFILALASLSIIAAAPAADCSQSSAPRLMDLTSPETQLRQLVNDYIKMMSAELELDQKLLSRMIAYKDGKGSTAEDLDIVSKGIKDMIGPRWNSAVITSIDIEGDIAKVVIKIEEEEIKNKACKKDGQWYLDCDAEHTVKTE